MKKYLRYVVLLLTVVISACSSLDTRQTGGDVSASSTQLHRVGRFAVLVFDKTQDRNTDSIQGNFDWMSSRQQVVLDLSSPLGQILARVEVYPGMSRLTRANGEVFEAETADVLIQDVIGREFPVSGLQYWIHGKTIPGVAVNNAEYDSQHRLIRFTQAGWTVVAQHYDQYGPKKFQLLNNQATERISIRIVME